MRLLFLLLAAGCTPTGGGMPADFVVLPEGAVREMLQQCSRSAPPAGEGTWRPDGAVVAALEAALPAALRTRREIMEPPSPRDPDWSRAPEGWRRQYVGIIRGGRRFVYGSFFPTRPDEDSIFGDGWQRVPVRICDGGPVFFGVEYDVEASRFTHFAFNGAF